LVIKLAWRLFFANNLTDGKDKRRKVEKQEIGGLKSIEVIAGEGLRSAGYELGLRRVTGYGLRVAGKKGIERVA
jgi:hypothetical protein